MTYSINRPSQEHFSNTLNFMKREEIARELSERNQVTRAQARDEVDELVRRILASLRRGRPVELPGVGKLVTGNASRSGKR